MKKLLVLTLATVIAGLVTHAWVYRVEYFMIPAAWHETREAWKRLDALSPFSADRSKLADELGEAVTVLIRLQDPDFLGGTEFDLQKIPTSPNVTLVCYQNTQAEALPHPESGDLLPERMDYHHRFLRSSGQLFVPDSGFFVGHERSFSHADDGNDERSEARNPSYHDSAPWRSKPGIRVNYSKAPLYAVYGPFLFSWDERGFVPHGVVNDDNTIGRDTSKYILERFDEDRMQSLWGSAPPVTYCEPSRFMKQAVSINPSYYWRQLPTPTRASAHVLCVFSEMAIRAVSTSKSTVKLLRILIRAYAQ